MCFFHQLRTQLCGGIDILVWIAKGSKLEGKNKKWRFYQSILWGTYAQKWLYIPFFLFCKKYQVRYYFSEQP